MSISEFKHRAADTVRVSLWLLGMVMLLVFPLQRLHSSRLHFRAREVRRSVLRHTLLQRIPKNATVEEAYQRTDELTRPLENRDEDEPELENSAIATIRVKPFLTRLKLGPPRARSQDPLLL
jgi:hypothetical protein